MSLSLAFENQARLNSKNPNIIRASDARIPSGCRSCVTMKRFERGRSTPTTHAPASRTRSATGTRVPPGRVIKRVRRARLVESWSARSLATTLWTIPKRWRVFFLFISTECIPTCPQVLGGHGEMWGETVDASDLEQTVWPRLASISEILWSDRDDTRPASARAPNLQVCTREREKNASHKHAKKVGARRLCVAPRRLSLSPQLARRQSR